MKFGQQALVRALNTTLEKAIIGQTPIAAGYIRRVRDRYPDARPEQLIKRLEQNYLGAVTTGGTAAGAIAAPAVGTAPALALNVAEVGWFLETTVLYILAVAEVHQLPITDPERRRTLILAVVTGDGLSGGVAKAAARSGPHLARKILTRIPMSTIRATNKVLGRNFVTKYGTKQGVLVLGQQLPFGLGALIGGGGNAAIGYATIRTARKVFGTPPEEWPPSGTPTPPAQPKSPPTAPAASAPIQRYPRSGLHGQARRAATPAKPAMHLWRDLAVAGHAGRLSKLGRQHRSVGGQRATTGVHDQDGRAEAGVFRQQEGWQRRPRLYGHPTSGWIEPGS